MRHSLVSPALLCGALIAAASWTGEAQNTPAAGLGRRGHHQAGEQLPLPALVRGRAGASKGDIQLYGKLLSHKMELKSRPAETGTRE